MNAYCMPIVESKINGKLIRYPKYMMDIGNVPYRSICERDGYIAIEADTSPNQHTALMAYPDVTDTWIPGIADAMSALGIPVSAASNKRVVNNFIRIFG